MGRGVSSRAVTYWSPPSWGPTSTRSGTSLLLAEGCIMVRACHPRHVPGWHRHPAQGPAGQVRRDTPAGRPPYLNFVAEEIRQLLASLGLRSLEEAIGRVDLLRPSLACRDTGPRCWTCPCSSRRWEGPAAFRRRPPDPEAPVGTGRQDLRRPPSPRVMGGEHITPDVRHPQLRPDGGGPPGRGHRPRAQRVGASGVGAGQLHRRGRPELRGLPHGGHRLPAGGRGERLRGQGYGRGPDRHHRPRGRRRRPLPHRQHLPSTAPPAANSLWPAGGGERFCVRNSGATDPCRGGRRTTRAST